MGVVGNRRVFVERANVVTMKYIGVPGGFGGIYREHLLRVSSSVAVASFFHGPPARVGLLLQAARGRHAQL